MTIRHLGPDAAEPLSDAELNRMRLNGHAQESDDADIGVCVTPVPRSAGKPPTWMMRSNERKTADHFYKYSDSEGRLLGYVLRWEEHDGERKQFRPVTYWRDENGKSEWRAKSWPKGSRPLFGQDKLAKHPDAKVLLPEGEKAAVAAEKGPLAEALKWEDVVAVTWPGGGQAVKCADFSPLKGRDVIVLPDDHPPGEATADELVKILHNVGARTVRRWKAPPEAKHVKADGWDIADDIPPNWEPEAMVKSILGAPEVKSGRAPDQFAPVFLDEITVDDEPSYIVDGIVPGGPSFGEIPAPPKSLKSFFLADLLMHIAIGKQYAGRKVLQGAVVYITSEGVSGVKRRLVAMRKHHGIEGKNIPFMLVPVMPNLGSGTEDLEALKAVIAATIQGLNLPLRAIVIDTLRRATPGKSENDPKDMSIFLANADALAQAFTCFVGVAHHSPRSDDTRGSGTNAIEGACDVILPVTRCDVGDTPRATVTVGRMKDGEEGDAWTFEVRSVEVGKDRNQNPKFGGYVVLLDEPVREAPAAKPKGRKEPATLSALRAALTEALDAAGKTIHVRGDGPAVKAVPVPLVLAEFRLRHVTGSDDPKKRADAQLKAFNRALEKLSINRGVQDGTEYLWN